MVLWRSVGLNYVRYSQIAAEVTRKCLKVAGGKGAAKPPGDATLRMTAYEGGKPVPKKQ